MPDLVRWALWCAPSLLFINWIAVLFAASAITWRGRAGAWPRWRPLADLAAGIALHPRLRARTLLLAAQLLLLDLVAPLALLLARQAAMR